MNLDAAFGALDNALRSIAGVADAGRPSPADSVPASTLSEDEKRQAARLLRVDHCGEVCAQALYEGQALAARSAESRASLASAAREEEDHLAWCQQRLAQLDSRPSLLCPAFYAASFALGAATGLLGDRVSLGFVEATEDQVRDHLDRHLQALPPGDGESRAILQAMREDESRHGRNAIAAGGALFPAAIRQAMAIAARAMTATTYRI